jgi:PPOX class probable F420-dependent enzyme
MATDAAPIAPIYRSTARELTDPMREFLARQPFATLATLNEDGSIHLVPTWYLFDDGQFFIATWSGSRKARNVAARAQATVTVDDRGTAEWVSATGTAQVLTGQRSLPVNDRLRRRYMTVAGLQALGPVLERAENVTIAITPHRWNAWDYQSTMLAALQNAGIPLEDAHTWYLP